MKTNNPPRPKKKKKKEEDEGRTDAESHPCQHNAIYQSRVWVQ